MERKIKGWYLKNNEGGFIAFIPNDSPNSYGIVLKYLDLAKKQGMVRTSETVYEDISSGTQGFTGENYRTSLA